MPVQAVIFTVGDRYLAPGARDEGGDILFSICLKLGWDVVVRQALGDEENGLAENLVKTADSGLADVIFTLDGIGIRAGERVPEVMYHVCEKWIPGLPEIIRMKAFEKTPGIILTRGLAGIRGKTVIVNLPGSPSAVKDAMDIVKPALKQALEQIKGT